MSQRELVGSSSDMPMSDLEAQVRQDEIDELDDEPDDEPADAEVKEPPGGLTRARPQLGNVGICLLSK